MVRGKKAILQIAALAMSAMMAFGFAACGEKEHQHADADGDGYCDTDGTWIGEGEDPALHEHTYDTTKWAYDSTYHYHAGNCGHDVLKDRERHSFEGNAAKCTVCDYERGFDEIYQMYLGGLISSFVGQYQCKQVSGITNWSEYAEKGYKLDYDEATQTWKTKSSIELGIADQVVVINVVSHTQYGVSGGGTTYGVRVDEAGKYFVSLKLGESRPVLTKDYGDHTHSYTAWGYDADNHWKQCAEDGEKDPSTVAPHNFDNTDGHCTDGCGAVSQEKCKHTKGYQYNYTKTTVPMSSDAASKGLKKYCPDCGKEEKVEVERGATIEAGGGTSLILLEGNYYSQSFVGGVLAIREPGVYTVEVIEPVWDDGATLTLTAISANIGGVLPNAPVTSRNYRPNYGKTTAPYVVYDYGEEQNNGFLSTELATKWKNKITINGQPASVWTNKWEAFTSISVTVTQEDIDGVTQQYTKPATEDEKPQPLPKEFYFNFFAVAKKTQEVKREGIYGAWLTTITKSEIVTTTCDHKNVTFDKTVAEEAWKAASTTAPGTIKGTCPECNSEVDVPYDAKAGLNAMLVTTEEIGKTYFINASGYIAFKIEEAGTYTFTKQIIYRVPNVVDDDPDDDKDTSKTYLNFFRDVYITTAAKAGKTAANAIYADGAWKETELAQKWAPKIKFDGNVGGTGYETKTETLTFTITVTEEDLQNLGDGNSLFVTLGVWFGEVSGSWSGAQTGSYFLVSMKKEAAPAAATVSAQEVALPVKQDN